jgi:hypothetical protein
VSSGVGVDWIAEVVGVDGSKEGGVQVPQSGLQAAPQ